MKIKLWIIGVSLVFVQGCTGVLLSSLNSKSGDGSSGLMNLLVLLGLGGAAGGSSSGNEIFYSITIFANPLFGNHKLVRHQTDRF